MIKFVTVWFLVAAIPPKIGQSKSAIDSYTIPFASQEVCLLEARRINRNAGYQVYKAHCQFGQVPVAVLEKGDE